jgi:uncharacterized damage-inducible protein DinB
MIDYFIRLFHHSQWANERQLAGLPAIIDQEPGAVAIMSHIIMVDRLWFLRVNGTSERPAIWEPVAVETLIKRNQEYTADWIKLIGSLSEADLDRMIAYNNFKGVPYENSIRAHHRGQVNLLIRKAGIEPPLIDYIAFARHEFD